MRLSSRFPVPAPPDRAFGLLMDPAVVRSCIPGCEELTRVDDTTFQGRLVNVIAHVRFNAGFSVTMTSVEPPSKVVAVLTGEDHRLGSSIKMDAVLSVEPDPAGSIVGYEMEMALWGKLGRLGESIVRKRTAEVEKQFVAAFSAACAAQEAPVPAPTEPAAAARTGHDPQPGPRGWWARLVDRLRRRWFGRRHAGRP